METSSFLGVRIFFFHSLRHFFLKVLNTIFKFKLGIKILATFYCTIMLFSLHCNDKVCAEFASFQSKIANNSAKSVCKKAQYNDLNCLPIFNLFLSDPLAKMSMPDLQLYTSKFCLAKLSQNLMFIILKTVYFQFSLTALSSMNQTQYLPYY